MRIVQVIDSLNVGGAQKLVVVFTREMLQRGHHVLIISLSQPEEDSPVYQDLKKMDAEISYVSLRSIIDLRSQRELTARIKSWGPDIVHTQLNYANIHGTLAAGMAGIPAVASLHNASVHLYSYRPYRTWLETMVLKHYSRRIIACGFTVARVQQHRFGSKALEVIPNPVPDQPLVENARKAALRKEFLADGKGNLLVSVGRLIPEKGYPDLIRAISLLNNQQKNPVQLLIAGNGYLLEELQRVATLEGQQDNIHFLGLRSDIPDLLAASDIYVSSSHYEGQSLAVLEAMASGLPVVATDVGDNRQIISEDCGCVLPAGQPELLAEEIKRLIGNPGERKRLGENAGKCVRQTYSSNVWADRLLELYSEVLHG